MRVESPEKLAISHLDSRVLHDGRGSLVVLLIEGASFYVNNATQSTAFNAQSFYVSPRSGSKNCTVSGLVQHIAETKFY